MEDEGTNSQWRQRLDAGHAEYENGRYPAAEVEFAAALKVAERFGDSDLRLARTLNNLAVVYQLQGKYGFAEDSYLRALAVKRRALGDDNAEVAVELHNLAVLNSARRRFTEAEGYYRRALSMRGKHLGIDHPDYASTVAEFAKLMRRTGRADEAALFEARFRSARRPG